MYARFCLLSDVPAINKILQTQDTMYGMDIRPHKPEISRRLKQLIENGMESRSRLMGAFDEHDQLVGYTAAIFFRDLPFWRISMMFFTPELAAKPRAAVKTGSILLENMVKYAERFGTYQFFYVVRDSQRHRLAASMEANPYVDSRYDIVDMRVVKPHEKPAYQFYRDILGMTWGNNEKTIVIRQGILKPEYRPNLWQTS